MAQFRCDILPIRIETARYKGEPLDEIICNFCILNKIEDESHFLLKCVICYNTCHYDKLFTYLLSIHISIYRYVSTSCDPPICYLYQAL